MASYGNDVLVYHPTRILQLVQAEVTPSPAIPSWCRGPNGCAVGLVLAFRSFHRRFWECGSHQSFSWRVTIGTTSGRGRSIPCSGLRSRPLQRCVVLQRSWCPRGEEFPSFHPPPLFIIHSSAVRTSRNSPGCPSFCVRRKLGFGAEQLARKCDRGFWVPTSEACTAGQALITGEKGFLHKCLCKLHVCSVVRGIVSWKGPFLPTGTKENLISRLGWCSHLETDKLTPSLFTQSFIPKSLPAVPRSYMLQELHFFLPAFDVQRGCSK